MTEPHIKVLLVNHVSRISGGERGLLNIVHGMTTRSVSYVVSLPPPFGALGDALTRAGVQIVPTGIRRLTKTANPLRLLRYALNYTVTVLGLYRTIRKEKIDLVHANSNTAHLYAGAAAKLAGVPSIWHCRDLVELGRAGKWMGRMCTRCVAISKAVARHVAPLLDNPAKLVTLHNGIDTDAFAPATRQDRSLRAELGLADGEFAVAMVAQLVPWKRHMTFLRAAAEAAAVLPHARFLVVGADLFGDHPGYRRELEDCVRTCALENKVAFTGYREDMPRVMRAIDLLVHPALREPFGRSIAEAMAAGKPVVAVDANGPGELIRSGEDGILVPNGTEPEIAEAIVRVAREPGLAARLGRNARERILTHFSLDAFTRGLSTVYREAACTSP